MVAVNWFPGHMARVIALLKEKLKQIDLVLEVRDARVPLSSANPILEDIIKAKRRVVVMNKADLAHPHQSAAFVDYFNARGVVAMPVCAKDPRSVKKLMDTVRTWMEREKPNSELLLALVLGLPNCGKSSLINGLKQVAHKDGNLPGRLAYNKKATSGPLPGVTTLIGGFKITNKPPIFVLDTPGVTMPSLVSADPLVALKLGLAGILNPNFVDDLDSLSALLQLLNCPAARQELQYVAEFGRASNRNRRERAQVNMKKSAVSSSEAAEMAAQLLTLIHGPEALGDRGIGAADVQSPETRSRDSDRGPTERKSLFSAFADEENEVSAPPDTSSRDHAALYTEEGTSTLDSTSTTDWPEHDDGSRVLSDVPSRLPGWSSDGHGHSSAPDESSAPSNKRSTAQMDEPGTSSRMEGASTRRDDGADTRTALPRFSPSRGSSASTTKLLSIDEEGESQPLLSGGSQFARQRAWHPGQEDTGMEDGKRCKDLTGPVDKSVRDIEKRLTNKVEFAARDSRLLEQLLQSESNLAHTAEVSRERVSAVNKYLRAYREGLLGRYTFDEVPSLESIPLKIRKKAISKL